MVNLLRLALSCLLLFAGSAFALVPQVTGYKPNVPAGGPYSSSQAACDAAKAWFDSNWVSLPPPSNTSTMGPCVDGGATITRGDGQEYNFASAVTSSCPANSAPSGSGQCQCEASASEVGGQCVPKQSELEEFCNSHKKNTFSQKGTIGSSSPTPQSSCYKPYPPFEGADAAKGCEMTLRDMVKAPGDDGLMNWSGTGTPTGATCEDAAATDEKPKAEDDKCVGGFSGTVNGVQKCIPAEPDKGIEGVKTGTVTDADGTKHEIKEETKCEGTQCTTTTTTKTTTTSGTTTTTTKSETQSLTDKCAKDPSNKVCTKTNGGTGSAGSPTGCAANSSGAGCGGAGAGISGLYEGKDATVQGIMDKAVADLKGSGIGGAVGSFFTVPGGGAAPSMVWNIPYFNVTVSVPGLSSEPAMAIYPVLKGVLLLVAGFVAFRIAIDN